jgi:hypothetical protein
MEIREELSQACILRCASVSDKQAGTFELTEYRFKILEGNMLGFSDARDAR